MFDPCVGHPQPDVTLHESRNSDLRRGAGSDLEGRKAMAHSIRRVDYFTTTVRDRPGEAYKLLSHMAELGLNMLAFTAVPVGPMYTQLTLFPEDTPKMEVAAQRAGMSVDGPHPAFLVQGDDELGALAEIHQRLFQADVNVYASTGVTDGRGSYGYLIYVRPEEYDRAARALSV
jgi:hypothetical protein